MIFSLIKDCKNVRGRLFKGLLKLSMFDYEIKYEKHATNTEPIMLSKNPISHFIIM